MKKGIISLAIVLAMVVSMFVPAFAEEAAEPLAPIVIDFAEGGASIGALEGLKADWSSAGAAGTSQYNETEGAWELKVGTLPAETAKAPGADMYISNDISAYGKMIVIAKLTGGTGAGQVKEGGLHPFPEGEAGEANFYASEEYSKLVLTLDDESLNQGKIAFFLSKTDGSLPDEGLTLYVKAVVFVEDETAATAFDLDAYRQAKLDAIQEAKDAALEDAFVIDYSGVATNRYEAGAVLGQCGNKAGWTGVKCGESYWDDEGFWHVEITETADAAGAAVTGFCADVPGFIAKGSDYVKAVIVYRTNVALNVREGGLESDLGNLPNTNDEWGVAVINVPAGNSANAKETPYAWDKMIINGEGGVGTYVDVAAVAFFTDEIYAQAFDLDLYEQYVAENVYDYDENVYFDYNGQNWDIWYKEGQYYKPLGDDVSVVFFYDFLELGLFRCTTHGLGCYVDESEEFFSEEFFEEGYWDLAMEPVIKCQVTQNSKYATVEATYVPGEDNAMGGIEFKVTPMDQYITKDIDIEVQMYVIRNVANKAHKSNTVKFTLTLTNRYINDKDIAAVAGEDCALFIDETAYVVKGAQFEEAGDKSVSIAWWNGTDDSDFVIDFESVVGQKGINFGWGYIAEAPEAVKDLSTTAKWAGLTFGSDEAVVNGAKVSVFNSFGEDYKYAYVLDGEGNLTYIGEYAKDAEYIEFAVEAGDALGTMLVSSEKFETVVEEPEQPSEPDEDDKEAPGTGAGANMMSLAVVAVVALAGAAVVASKR